MTSWQEPTARTTLRLAPFRGVRYTSRAGDLQDLTFTPPTSWSSVPADLLPQLDPHHILRLLAPAFGPDAHHGASEARTALTQWLADGIMRRDESPALYVYEQPTEGAHIRGVIGTVDRTTATPPFLDHEEIIDTLVETQATLERTLGAQVEPILALHRGAPVLQSLLDDATAAPPDVTIGEGHRMWRITDAAMCAAIADAIPDEPCLIADGHHRHAAWQNAALTLLTDRDQPGLQLGAIHRVIAHVDLASVLASDVVEARPLADRNAALRYLDSGPTAGCVLYAAGRFYATTPTEPSAKCAAPELAVCHLHSQWLHRWAAAETDVDYVHDVDEAIQLAGHDRLAVLLPVPNIGDVVAAASEDRPLPRKATSFRPKPLVGTVLSVRES